MAEELFYAKLTKRQLEIIIGTCPGIGDFPFFAAVDDLESKMKKLQDDIKKYEHSLDMLRYVELQQQMKMLESKLFNNNCGTKLR